MKNPQKVNLTSLNLSEEKIAELYRILPEAFADNKIDFDKLRTVLGDSVVQGSDKFSFSWAGKSGAIRNVLVPSHLTLNPVPGESIKWDESENLFIEGDNLEVLKLLQKAYFEKVKMIYIDPPYNTGHDFVYNDDFSTPLDNYHRQTGQKNGEGDSTTTNKETGGRYHSDWLSMMYPRLKLAWNLLCEEGVILVSINDIEMHRLRMLMDEVFGEENFVTSLIWKSRQIVDSRAENGASNDHEYILIYGKNSNGQVRGKEIDLSKYSNPDNDERGPWMSNSILGLATKNARPNLHYAFANPETGVEFLPPPESGWRYSRDTINQKIAKGRILFPKDRDGRPREKKFLNERTKEFTGFSSVLGQEVGYTLNGTKELRELLGGNYFPFPKPVSLIKILLLQGLSGEGDIVLDFFSGSGTTAHAVMELNVEQKTNHKWISVQLPEKIEVESDAYEAGYVDIASITKERIRRVIKGYGDNPQPIDTGFKVFTLTESNYPENNFVLDPEKSPEENQKEFVAYLQKAKQKKLFGKDDDMSLVYENVVKEGLSLNSKIEKIAIGKNSAYQVVDGDQQLLVCLEDKLASETVKELTDKAHKDRIFICLESSLDDTTAANLALNLDLKTI